jgi:membrane fusion protein, multidrug efflux system
MRCHTRAPYNIKEALGNMADTRSLVAASSIVVAVFCAGWAIYATKHAGTRPQSPQGAPAGVASRPSGPPAAAAGGGVPKPAAAPGGGGAPIVVVTAPARREHIEVGIEAIGTAISNEAVSVTSKISNLVTAIHFRDGEKVQAGQVLVELDRAQATADLAAATADYTNSVNLFNRSRELLATQSLSKAQFDQLEATMKSNDAKVAAARARLADTYIRAPFTGHVGLRRVSLGTLINPGTVITTLDDTSVIKVDFSVPDNYVSEVHAGQSLLATSTAYPSRRFEGRVVSVDSRVEPSTRSVTVRGLVPNGDAALKPGMFLTVTLAKEQRTALVIPEQALVPEQAKQYVYVSAGGRVAKREVRIGRREPGRVEVVSGVSEGDRVVTEGTLKLRDGAPVRESDATEAQGSPTS